MSAAESMPGAREARLPIELQLANVCRDGLEPNLRRMLEFVAVPYPIEFEVLAYRQYASARFSSTRVAHARDAADAVTLCRAANEWISDGVYVLPSKLREGVETRHSVPGNWFDTPKGESTSDNDIALRYVLSVDCDVKRPRGISATDAEMALSVQVAERVWDYLGDIAGSECLAYVHSGNGRQIWIALAGLPANEEIKFLCASILAGLNAQFGTECVTVDLKLSDAKRILPACGTIKRKGTAGITERPHRATAIVGPVRPRRLREDELWSLHQRIRQDCNEDGRAKMDEAKGIKSKKTTTKPKATSNAFERANAQDPRSVAEWLDLYDAGEFRCPGCGESQGVDVIDHGLKCLHNRCNDKGKNGFRTNVDLVMEVRGVDKFEAVNLLAERFGFEPLPERRQAPANDVPPDGFYDEEPPAPVPAARRPTSPLEVLRRWRTEGALVHEPTGFDHLDEITGGGPVYGTRLYLGGAPDAGKTAVEAHIAHLWARRGVFVGILAVDEEDGDLVTRLVQRTTPLDPNRRRFSRRDCEDRGVVVDEMEAALASIDERIRFFDETWTIEAAAAELERYAKEVSGGEPYRLALFVDSIQTVTCEANLAAKDQSPREAVTANVRALRAVATRYRLIAIATSELNRNAYRSVQAAEESNDMAAGKESGAIEYSARVLLTLRSAKDAPDLIQVRASKNKHGPSYPRPEGEFYLRIDCATQWLTQADAPDMPDASESKRAMVDAKIERDSKALLAIIVANPGIGSRGLRDKCSLGPTAIGRALEHLQAEGCVENRPSRHGTRLDPHYFAVAGGEENEP